MQCQSGHRLICYKFLEPNFGDTRECEVGAVDALMPHYLGNVTQYCDGQTGFDQTLYYLNQVVMVVKLKKLNLQWQT